MSANMRYQLRRSKRHYAGLGTLAIRRARTRIEATDFLARLAGLHQVYWTSRGKPGAFANPAMGRFHRALIDSAFDSGAIDLLEVIAGKLILGYLYNFKHHGRVYAYQSGFDYALPHRHCKPGLTCHHLAIEMYLGEGGDAYDFLAGRDRYKKIWPMRQPPSNVVDRWLRRRGQELVLPSLPHRPENRGIFSSLAILGSVNSVHITER